jgi:hypothetical protein
MKAYKLSKSVKRSPFIYSLTGFGIVIILGLLNRYIYEEKFFVIFLAVGILIISLLIYFSLTFEEIVIDDDHLIYKKLFRKQVIAWNNVKELILKDPWTAKPELCLKGEDFSIDIDFHSFDYSEELKNFIMLRLKHLQIRKCCDFTEI